MDLWSPLKVSDVFYYGIFQCYRLLTRRTALDSGRWCGDPWKDKRSKTFCHQNKKVPLKTAVRTEIMEKPASEISSPLSPSGIRQKEENKWKVWESVSGTRNHREIMVNHSFHSHRETNYGLWAVRRLWAQYFKLLHDGWEERGMSEIRIVRKWFDVFPLLLFFQTSQRDIFYVL